MDACYDIINEKGDHIMVALSRYDKELIEAVSTSAEVENLEFFDVSLIRDAGTDYVGLKSLVAVAQVLANFIDANLNAVLCFYCDAHSEVKRTHLDLSPQAYRSRLFSMLFNLFVRNHPNLDLINQCLELNCDGDENDTQYAHFICRGEHLRAVEQLSIVLMEGK